MRLLPGIICLMMVMGTAWGQDPPQMESGSAQLPLERPDDPPADESMLASVEPDKATENVVENGFVSVQVNVDEDQKNRRGDAANEPSIAVDPTAPNRMAIGWRQFDSAASNFREAGVAWSDDGGRTWHSPGTIDNGIFRSDPILESDAEGHFFYNSLSIPNNLIQAEFFDSRNQGQSWGGPESAYGGDKVWIAIDRSEGIGHGNIYASWSTASNQWGARIFTRSTNGGNSYSFPQALHPAPIWGSMTVGRQGELYIVGNAAFNTHSFVLLRSDNVRDPDATPTFESSIIPLRGTQRTGQGSFGTPNPDGLLGQVWVGVDTSDGPNRDNVYVVSSLDPPGSDPQDVIFCRSTDGGLTWSPSIRVNVDDRDAWQWFATMSVAPNGRIDIVWIESLTGAEPNIGQLFYTSSADGGTTWADAIPASPVFDSHLGYPNQNKMGDYFHMRSDLVGADLAWAATFNEEEDVYYLRLGDRDCNANGVGDAEEMAAGSLVDCDDNDIPDLCEIAARPGLDENDNDYLDACEPPPRQGAGRAGG